jgi:hypothetical protein
VSCSGEARLAEYGIDRVLAKPLSLNAILAVVTEALA